MNKSNSKRELHRQRSSHVQPEQANKRCLSGITKAASRWGSHKTGMAAIRTLDTETIQNNRD